jgi:ribosomal protein S18 acetylase RimI-like enzyme
LAVSGLTFRPYKTTDFDVMLHLLEQNTPGFFAKEEREDYVHYLKEKREDYFIAVMQGRTVAGGGINYFPEEHVARISWDVVHPEFQGVGIGTALLKYRLLKIRKTPDIHTLVVRTTQLVYKFYENQGFKLKKIKPDYWSAGYDLYYMELKI